MEIPNNHHNNKNNENNNTAGNINTLTSTSTSSSSSSSTSSSSSSSYSSSIPSPISYDCLFSPEELQVHQLSSVTWRYEQWLHSYPLNRSTALDYFKHSQFYDRTCNNELALMQNRPSTSGFVGIEYSVDSHSTDQYLLIRQNYRFNENNVQLLRLYYIIGVEPVSSLEPAFGTIFPMPVLSDVLKQSLFHSIFYLEQAFDDLSKLIQYDVNQGYCWKLDDQEQNNKKTDQKLINDLTEEEIIKTSLISSEIPKRNAFSHLIDSAIMRITQPAISLNLQQQHTQHKTVQQTQKHNKITKQ